MEEIVIDASNNSFLFNQNTVFFRFDFKTDGSNRKDSYVNVDFEGFTFDDFKVISLLVPCNASIPVGLNATAINASSANINWDIITGVSYELRYKETSLTDWEPIVAVNSNNFGAQFYTDFTSQSKTLTKGHQYSISITSTWIGTLYNEGYSVWIDYNKDGDFEDSGEQVWTQSPTQQTPVTGNFTIPSSAVESATRMRISMKYNDIPDPCETFTWGEVEDYTVFIEPDAPDTTIPVIALIGNGTINLDVGALYNEQGATAIDNIDGDITSSIVIGGDAVNTSIAGVYNVTYNVSDAAVNAAITIIRIVNINELTSGCSGGINSFPYSEGFENSFGAWTQSSSDDINWSLNSGSTPSSNTGPNSANEGNFYIYVEASGNGTGFPNKQAILNSPCFDLSGLTESTFSFNYHMFGSNDMGTIDLEITVDEGLTWTSIWSETGNKGNSWQTVNVDISAYIGNGIQICFNRITGGTWQADIALDNLRLIEGIPTNQSCAGGITSYPYSENFENSIGAWTQSSNDDINWSVDANGTPSNNTGPSSANDGNF